MQGACGWPDVLLGRREEPVRSAFGQGTPMPCVWLAERGRLRPERCLDSIPIKGGVARAGPELAPANCETQARGPSRLVLGSSL